jgi:hypothetical protein
MIGGAFPRLPPTRESRRNLLHAVYQSCPLASCDERLYQWLVCSSDLEFEVFEKSETLDIVQKDGTLLCVLHPISSLLWNFQNKIVASKRERSAGTTSFRTFWRSPLSSDSSPCTPLSFLHSQIRSISPS